MSLRSASRICRWVRRIDTVVCLTLASGRPCPVGSGAISLEDWPARIYRACVLERNRSGRIRISSKRRTDHDSMPQQLLFELNGARVTPHIATFRGTSYQIANIGSVHVVRRRKYNPFAIIIFLLGLGILVAAIVKSRVTGLAEEYFSMAATAVVLMVASVLLQLIWPRRVYVLVLRTSSGDVDAIMSRNKEFVSNVQKAVEQAFAVRARQPPEMRAED
jgi:Family of unknown function (DUF6232)